jgi:hypothetical protein
MKISEDKLSLINQAREQMTEESWEKLREITAKASMTLNENKKNPINNDICMSAFCKAIKDKVISKETLTKHPSLIRLYNATTNKLSDWKLQDILKDIHDCQPKAYIKLSISYGDEIIKEFIFIEEVSFNGIFRWVLGHFKITPQMVRTDMHKKLGIPLSTVNNIGQILSRVDDDNLVVSIMTITRLVNMVDHTIQCELIDDGNIQ